MPQYPMSFNYPGPFNLFGTPGQEFTLQADDGGRVAIVPASGGGLPTPTIDGGLLIADVEGNTFDQNLPTSSDGSLTIIPSAGNLDFAVDQSGLGLQNLGGAISLSSQADGILNTAHGGNGASNINPVDGMLLVSQSGTFIQQGLFSPEPQTSTVTLSSQSFNNVDASAAAVVCTLPDGTQPTGQQIIVNVVVIGHDVTFGATAGQTINGADPASLPALSNLADSYTFTSDSSGNWWVTAAITT